MMEKIGTLSMESLIELPTKLRFTQVLRTGIFKPSLEEKIQQFSLMDRLVQVRPSQCSETSNRRMDMA